MSAEIRIDGSDLSGTLSSASQLSGARLRGESGIDVSGDPDRWQRFVRDVSQWNLQLSTRL